MTFFNPNKIKNYPGAQKSIWRVNSIMTLLILLTLIFFCLTIHATLQNNPGLIGARDWLKEISALNLLDIKTSCSIFVSLLGLILVRHHFILGFKPRIIYETNKSIDETTKIEYWEVRVKNVGLGAAVIKKYVFRLNISSIDNKEYDCDFQELIETLQSHNIFLEKDFMLGNLTKGYTLTSKKEKVIFKICLPKAFGIKQLDLKMIFIGFLGGKYKKEVYLIPRRGIFKKSLIELIN